MIKILFFPFIAIFYILRFIALTIYHTIMIIFSITNGLFATAAGLVILYLAYRLLTVYVLAL